MQYGLSKLVQVMTVMSQVLEILESLYNYLIVSKSIYSNNFCTFLDSGEPYSALPKLLKDTRYLHFVKIILTNFFKTTILL